MEMIAGFATGLALVAFLAAGWLVRHCMRIEEDIYVLQADLRCNEKEVRQCIDKTIMVTDVLRADMRKVENELELSKQLQYADTGIYNMTTDQSTGKQAWIKTQELEDSFIRQQAGRSPDEVLQAAQRIVERGRT
jgi:hypothetical protein